MKILPLAQQHRHGQAPTPYLLDALTLRPEAFTPSRLRTFRPRAAKPAAAKAMTIRAPVPGSGTVEVISAAGGFSGPQSAQPRRLL